MMMGWVVAMAFLGSMSVGEVAPDFTVKDTDGTSWTLSKMVEQGPVVVAFFPKAFTGG
jgi:thioredoxin-dependent peroxiredoxin